jgi:hypothetical protein
VKTNGELKRPFAIFDEDAKMDLPWRKYGTDKSAIEHALVLVYWLELGNSYTVYDSRSGRALVQFTRRISGIQVMGE